MSGVAVPDSSCLIALSQVGLLPILSQVYARVVVPAAVVAEARRTIGQPPASFEIVDADPALPPPGQTDKFGRGEREVIGLALAIAPDAVVLDDDDARRWAAALGLPVVGTVGLLLRAKERGHLSSLKPALDRLREERFFVSDRLYRVLLVEAGEAGSP